MLSVAVITKFPELVAIGVPLIFPLLELRVNPLGRLELIVKVIDPCPPAALTGAIACAACNFTKVIVALSKVVVIAGGLDTVS